MYPDRILLSAYILLLLGGCTITGPAQDQWDIEESEDKIDFNSWIGSSDAQNQQDSRNVDEEEYQEYLEFLKWKKLKKEQDPPE
tara:strand:+ start:354 stop:605 length:252 start_codon:yes stop_codon:yes gene_type:complete